MSQDGMDVSRRDVVRTVGAGAAASAMSGVASAGPTEYNVGISPNATSTVGTVKGKADSVKKTIDLGGVRTIVTGTFSAEAVSALQNNPNVDYVSENGEVQKLGETLTWGVDRIDADKNISNGADGGGATVAIIDTGLDDDHPDLKGNIVGGKAFETQCGAESGGCRFGAEGYNNNDCNFAWSDDDDHGSHVGGTAGAVDNAKGVIGTAPGVDLLAGKALTGCGSGSFSAIASAIKWATDQGADVINMSLGASSGDSTLQDACQYAYNNNVVSVAAAGNSGPCTDCVSFPAAYSTVVAVSSITRSDTLSDFSSTGPEIEVAAPGGANDGNDSTSVLSTIPPESDSTSPDGYAYFVGTSMASPHAAGVAAQIVAETSLTDNQKIIDRLKSSAEDIGLASNEQGAGLVDAEAAIGSVDGSPSASWVTPSSGGTVSGTVTVQIDASDSEDANDTLDVTYNVAGGSSRTTSYNSTSGYYEDSLDTTQFADGSTTFEANVTDSAGQTTTSITATIDNVNDAPVVDSLSASEVETSDSDAEFDVSWQVSDADDDLSSVDLTLTQDSDGTTEDTVSVSVSGGSASGTDRLVAAGDEGTGNAYTVEATVTDSGSNTDTATASVSETESTNSAPVFDSYSVTEKGSPNPFANIDVDWAVSDTDGNLSSVAIDVIDADTGTVVDSSTTSVSGSSASGLDEFKIKGRGETYDVTTTVTDTKGASNSATQTVSE